MIPAIELFFILSGRMLLQADSNERCPADRIARAHSNGFRFSVRHPGSCRDEARLVAGRGEARIRNADDSMHRVFSAARDRNTLRIPIRSISRHFRNIEKFDVDLKNQVSNANQSVLLLPLGSRTSRGHFGAPTNASLL
ncbi:hypothetical protein [Burkholderia oklahomensis]|uniref:hypothetical protein n=1 Tax=Burkholderia oklahomensis TaxID=342113 RepID=UPI0011982804|nr:hypothetical protein [Burkholderia oklahomensis]QPS40489.1 hypothetical protein I6G57_19225 [Burkholderia oklahomensis]